RVVILRSSSNSFESIGSPAPSIKSVGDDLLLTTATSGLLAQPLVLRFPLQLLTPLPPVVSSKVPTRIIRPRVTLSHRIDHFCARALLLARGAAARHALARSPGEVGLLLGSSGLRQLYRPIALLVEHLLLPHRLLATPLS